MIISEVIVGTIETRHHLWESRISIDTGRSSDGNVYVKARDDEFLPISYVKY
jgi:hypothetical protein